MERGSFSIITPILQTVVSSTSAGLSWEFKLIILKFKFRFLNQKIIRIHIVLTEFNLNLIFSNYICVTYNLHIERNIYSDYTLCIFCRISLYYLNSYQTSLYSIYLKKRYQESLHPYLSSFESNFMYIFIFQDYSCKCQCNSFKHFIYYINQISCFSAYV